jgi:predicted SnoaL-like aldol condensation-catalyzing enzyme
MRQLLPLLMIACGLAACSREAPPDEGGAADAGAAPAADAATASPASAVPPAPAGRPPPGVSVNGKPLAPLVIAADQHALLASADPKLARNKRHVYDFWRIVYEAGHMERAAEFLAPEYIQHNPNVESGRDAFVATMSRARPQRPVEAVSRFPIIDIIAERDIVMVMWARKVRDREDPALIYEMTWFDVFRVDDATGLINEHWDSSERWGSAGRPPGAEFFP